MRDCRARHSRSCASAAPAASSTCRGSCRSPTGRRASRSASLPVGPSRHLVRFLVVDGDLIALKEEPVDVAEREYAVLGPPRAGRPAGRPPDRRRRARRRRATAILVTEYLAQLAPVPAAAVALPARAGRLSRPAAGRDGVAARRPPSRRRLLGRLLAREHALPARRRPDPGVPRRRRDERGPPRPVRRPAGVRPRDPRRERRLRPRRRRDAPGPAGGPRRRRSRRRRTSASATRRSGASCTSSRELPAGDRHAIRSRIRRLNELGFAVDEIEVVPHGRPGRP